MSQSAPKGLVNSSEYRTNISKTSMKSRKELPKTFPKKIVDLANVHSEGRIISFLEGGYDLLALSESIKEHFLALKI